MPSDNRSSNMPAASTRPNGMASLPEASTPQGGTLPYPKEDDSPVLRGMLRYNIPITRENYIKQNWQPVPEPWDVELEAELPRFLQDWTQFGFPTSSAPLPPREHRQGRTVPARQIPHLQQQAESPVERLWINTLPFIGVSTVHARRALHRSRRRHHRFPVPEKPPDRSDNVFHQPGYVLGFRAQRIIGHLRIAQRGSQRRLAQQHRSVLSGNPAQRRHRRQESPLQAGHPPPQPQHPVVQQRQPLPLSHCRHRREPARRSRPLRRIKLYPHDRDRLLRQSRRRRRLRELHELYLSAPPAHRGNDGQWIQLVAGALGGGA